jgi:DNA-binding NtrC family response regulator
MEIRLVPLRERREDIPYLAAIFIHDVTQRLNCLLTGMTAAAERILLQAPWPGNVRELRNVIERACLLTDGKMLGERDVVAAMPPALDSVSISADRIGSAGGQQRGADRGGARERRHSGERLYVRTAISQSCHGACRSTTRCARRAGTKRPRRLSWASAVDRCTGGSRDTNQALLT